MSKHHFVAQLDKLSRKISVAYMLKLLIVAKKLGTLSKYDELIIDYQAWNKAKLPGYNRPHRYTKAANQFQQYLNKIAQNKTLCSEERISADLLEAVVVSVTGLPWYTFLEHYGFQEKTALKRSSRTSTARSHPSNGMMTTEACPITSLKQAWEIVDTRILPFVDTVILYGSFGMKLIEHHKNEVIRRLQARGCRAFLVIQALESPVVEEVCRRYEIEDTYDLEKINQRMCLFQEKANASARASLIEVIKRNDIFAATYQGVLTPHTDALNLVLPVTSVVKEGHEVNLQLMRHRLLDTKTKEVIAHMATSQ
ncbi:hypothetical protein H1P_850024 [Hyella patelloides LEGE 07179]|uniref:Uncharacterized protein n=1 Tax=Hyella patelloides LEGE 07179 TaxID=945734 RepID=A0A563W4V1_9CYAN|nr:hypothetical protein [Hyella patelloides]VEP18667.1 hypothetical protein H1P_850024 [Hyella patelloides LEGE 07179]